MEGARLVTKQDIPHPVVYSDSAISFNSPRALASDHHYYFQVQCEHEAADHQSLPVDAVHSIYG